jgi:hypothetical protein
MEEGEHEVSPEVAAARAEEQTLAEEDLGEEVAGDDDDDVDDEAADEGGEEGGEDGSNEPKVN